MNEIIKLFTQPEITFCLGMFVGAIVIALASDIKRNKYKKELMEAGE